MPEWTGSFEGQGLYGDLPEDEYHRDVVPGGSLSHSGMKLLVPPGCPAIYKYERDQPHQASDSQETGTVVHGLVLGTGQPVEICDFPNWTTNKAKEARANARAKGRIPRLPKQWEQDCAIAKAVRDHDTTGALFAEGDPEVSGFTYCEEFGVWLRIRIDWLTSIGGTPAIGDFKTTADASPDHFAKSMADFAYHIQDPVYRWVLAQILGCDPGEIDFMFVTVPASPPYLPMIYRLKAADTERGWRQARQAMEIYRDCTASGTWPSWSADITELELPAYARTRIDRSLNEWNGISHDYDF